MDAPLHMIAHGKRMDEIPPETFIGKGVLIDARGARLIDANLLEGLTIEPGSIVLIYTGFGAKYRDRSYFENFPTITEEFAKRVVESKVKIVGMDLPGPDQPPFPIHKALLGNGILIIENLTNLDKLLGVTNFEVIALPAKLHADAAPARVIARIM
jgi:kynurenine formamidase